MTFYYRTSPAVASELYDNAKVMCAHENLGVSYEQFDSLLIPTILENSQI